MLNIVSDERSATASPPTIQIRSGAWCRAFVDQVPGIGMAHERLDVRGPSGTTRCRYEGGGKASKGIVDAPYALASCSGGQRAGDIVVADEVTLALGNGAITSAKVILDEAAPCDRAEQPFETRASIIGRAVDGSGQPVTSPSIQVFDVPASGGARPDVSVSIDHGTFRARLTQFPESELANARAHHALLRIDAAGKLPAFRDVYVHPGDAVDVGEIVLGARDAKTTTIVPQDGTASDSQGRVFVDIPPGALSQSTAITITALTQREELSYPLPDSTATTYGFYIEPDGIELLQPVTVRLANWRGLPTALDIPVGFFDPVRSLWVHAGVAKYDWRGLVR
jgi:hypothetical protein